MIDIFSSFWELLFFPLYHIGDDAFMGVLFYLLLLFYVLMFISALLHRWR